MADIDMSKTRYEDFYLSKYLHKKKDKDNVEVEVVGVDEDYYRKVDNSYHTIDSEENEEVETQSDLSFDSSIERKSSDLTDATKRQISYDKGLTVVKTEVVRHKNLSCDRCEPLTLQMVLNGTEKNKKIKKALLQAELEAEREKQESCDKCEAGTYKRKKNKGKAKPKRSKSRKFAIVLMVIVFAFVSCFLLADVLSNGYLIESVVNKIFHNDVVASYYAVEIATFSDVDSARITSEEIRASGGSGYVVHDELYRVIAEVYKSEKDAESVSTNLNLAGYVTNIYVFSIEEIDYHLLPTSVRNATKNVLKYQDIMYQSLFETAVSLEKQEIDYTSAREDIAMLASKINNMLVDYESSVNNKIDDKYVQKVRMQISSMIGALDNLTAEGSKNDRLLSDIRYINTMILNTHRAMIRSLQTAG